MGTWDNSVTGNDTAQDLKSEYQAAFFYNDVETALRKIDDYMGGAETAESDPQEWCDYYYSLADFMWSKGILTNTVKDEALRLIDSGFGLELWEDAGQKALEGRKRALQKFRKKITSPQPPKKKISIRMYTKPVFETGDVLTFQLQTADKTYTGRRQNVSERDFKEADGKYIAIRKIGNHVSCVSVIEPAVRDIWPIFQLYNKVFDKPPHLQDVIHLSSAEFPSGYSRGNPDGLFLCEGSLFYFRKRKHDILGNDQKDIEELCNKYDVDKRYTSNQIVSIFFGVNTPYNNADEDFVNAISDR